METSLDIQQIMNVLPHRYPFLLIDRVVSLEPKKRIVAIKNVTINEPFFPGHFPGTPVMPGVLILEAMGQAGGVLAFKSGSLDKDKVLIYFTGMDKVRFRKPVVPGDQIVFTVEVLKTRARVVKMAGVATVNDQKVAEAEMMAAVGDRP